MRSLSMLMLSLLISLLISQVSLATNPIDTHDYLVEFFKNPNKVMHEPLAHWDQNGNIITSDKLSPFRNDSAEAQAFFAAKDQARESICLNSGKDCAKQAVMKNNFAQVNAMNMVENFLYGPTIIRKLEDMEKNNLFHYTTVAPPWSDSFWPVYKGLLARRYADPGYPNSKNWADNYAYGQANMGSGGSAASPAEKYAALVGDGNTLTNSMWAKGQVYIKTWNFVPTWVGICHGWAPASIVYPMPYKTVTVPAYDGGSVTFYPSDIKGLASQAWAEAPPKVNFLGARCTKYSPAEDSMGRVIDQSCFDVNPGAFHMAIVNQLGVSKRGFIMDATYDFEVWNYPVWAYNYHYWNPQTLAVEDHFQNAVVPIEQFSIDKFSAYRSPQAKYIVGISMDVTYDIETNPSTRPIISVPHQNVRYVYDLELDADMNIIGGEWYSNFHPDFLWQPTPGSKPLSIGEKAMDKPVPWDGKGPVPAAIHAAAMVSSSRAQVISSVIETLIALSADKPPVATGDAPPGEVDSPTNPSAPSNPNNPPIPTVPNSSTH